MGETISDDEGERKFVRVFIEGKARKAREWVHEPAENHHANDDVCATLFAMLNDGWEEKIVNFPLRDLVG